LHKRQAVKNSDISQPASAIIDLTTSGSVDATYQSIDIPASSNFADLSHSSVENLSDTQSNNVSAEDENAYATYQWNDISASSNVDDLGSISVDNLSDTQSNDVSAEDENAHATYQSIDISASSNVDDLDKSSVDNPPCMQSNVLSAEDENNHTLYLSSDIDISEKQVSTENKNAESKGRSVAVRSYHHYEYIIDRGTEEYGDFLSYFPKSTGVYGVVQFTDKLSGGNLILKTGTILKFMGSKSAALPMVFVAGILNDKAADHDRAQFRLGTSSMSLLLINLQDEGGFNEYVNKCIACENTGNWATFKTAYITPC